MELNIYLWNQYEYGKISREEVIYNHLIDLLNKLYISVDGVYFEDVYQCNLGKGHYLTDNVLNVVKKLSQHF